MENGNPNDWHRGCEEDLPRNEFIIPKIRTFCDLRQPKSIAFLGCATGYIPQKLSETLEKTELHLIDIDIDRLKFAKGLNYRESTVKFYDQPLESIGEKIQTELIVISNTLLEFDPDEVFFRSLFKCLSRNGDVLVFLPDTLRDVVDEYVRGDRLALDDFIEGVRKIEKKDKFTLVKTNFHAHRLINLISQFLKAGFSLGEVEISRTRPKYFYLNFSRHQND